MPPLPRFSALRSTRTRGSPSASTAPAVPSSLALSTTRISCASAERVERRVQRRQRGRDAGSARCTPAPRRTGRGSPSAAESTASRRWSSRLPASDGGARLPHLPGPARALPPGRGGRSRAGRLRTLATTARASTARWSAAATAAPCSSRACRPAAELHDLYREMSDAEYLAEEHGSPRDRAAGARDDRAPRAGRAAARRRLRSRAAARRGAPHGLRSARAGALAHGRRLRARRARARRSHEEPVEAFAASRPSGFDVVVLADVIEHLEDPAAALDACAGLLADGGALCVITPGPVGAARTRWPASAGGATCPPTPACSRPARCASCWPRAA